MKRLSAGGGHENVVKYFGHNKRWFDEEKIIEESENFEGIGGFGSTVRSERRFKYDFFKNLKFQNFTECLMPSKLLDFKHFLQFLSNILSM